MLVQREQTATEPWIVPPESHEVLPKDTPV